MSRKPSKPETRIEDYLDVMTGGNAALPQPILRIEFYYAFLAGMAVELPQPILDDEKLLAKICGMAVEAPTYIPGISPRLYAYMAKKSGQDVQVPDPILRLECYWYDYSAGSPPSVQEYTGAVPVTFVADGTPLIDYIISGNTVQSGTPTPDNPVMPQGTGERTGNLFDKSATTDNSRVVYTTGEVGSLAGVDVSDYIPIESGEKYTLNIFNSTLSSITGHLFALYDNTKIFVDTGTHGITAGQTVYSFTVPSGCAYIRFNSLMTAKDNVMFVKGDYTAQTFSSYEPYSSEVWHDTPHYIHKTDTDILTLPQTIYADGTNATITLKGNEEHTGTPSPTSPIMPQGTGERTGNLFDKSATNTNNGYISDGYLKSDGSKNANTNYRASEYIAVSPNHSYTLYYGSNLNVGSTPLPYEPYGIKIPISSANTTTPVYLGEVETLRRIKKLVLTGEENFSLSGQNSNVFFASTASLGVVCVPYGIICTHYTKSNTNRVADMVNNTAILSTGALYFKDTAYTTGTQFKSYLAAQYAAGTPVTVWYVLANPETGIVNEPLMKIGDYADTLSMEQAGVQIPTANGSTTLDVETTVKPSEVYIKYCGEAVATLSTLPAEVSSQEATTEEANPEETEEEENER